MSLFIETCGQGDPLVLLHGWGLHGGVFDGVADELSQNHELHIVDLPGHGRSELKGEFTLKNIAAQIAEQVPTDASWLGWSLGGMVAVTAALHHAMKRLIIVASNPRFTADDNWQGMQSEVLEQFANALQQDYKTTLNRFIAIQAMGSARAKEELKMLRASLFAHGEPNPEALAGGLEILKQRDLRDDLKTISVPTLIIAGERDTLAPLSAMQAMQQQINAAKIAVIESAGHAPFLSHPDQFVHSVQEFLHG